MINIFSDAACRHFGNLKDVTSYFVGSGLTHNLSSKSNCDLIIEKINKVNFQNGENYLFFGEYDIRLSMGCGELPHLSTKLKSINVNKRRINQILNNYIYLISQLPNEFKIITPISSYPAELLSLEYFSTKLLMNFTTRVMDLNSLITLSGVNHILPKIFDNYKSEVYSHNPYICNTESISKLFCNKIGIDYNIESKGNMQFGTFYIQ